MTAEDDAKAHNDLQSLRAIAGDKAPDIQKLEDRFGPQAALKITGTVVQNLPGAGGSPSPHVKALLQEIQNQENGHPDPKRDAMETGLQNAIKSDPAFIDRLEAQLTKDPNLAGKIASRFMDNPDGVKDKVNDLVKSNNIAALMDSIPAKPAAAPAPVVAAGGSGPPAKPAPAGTNPFKEADELNKIQDPAIREGVKALFDKIASNATTKPEFDKLQDQQKRDMIAQLAVAAKNDPNFLGNVNGLVDSSPQLIAQTMDNLANHTEDTVKADLKKKRDQDAAPAAPAADSNPFSGMLNKLMGGDMMGRIMGVLSGLLNMIVGFFENMLSGPKHGVSNNNFGLSRDAGATPPGPASAPSSAAPGAVRQPQTAPGG